MTAKKTADAADGTAPKKKGGGKKGNGLKQRHRFTKPDGRTLDILMTEAKGQFNVRGTLTTPSATEGEKADKQNINVKQTQDKEEALKHYDSLIDEAKSKGWSSRKAGVLTSHLDEIPE